MKMKNGCVVFALSLIPPWIVLIHVFRTWYLQSGCLRSLTGQEELDSKWANCLIQTDIQELCRVNATNSTTDPVKCPLEELSQDCALLKKLHGYDKPVSQEELDFPLAFGLKMHSSPHQAEQLLRTIYRPHNVYCIHVDKKADEAVFRPMKSIASCLSNVFFTDRISFVYGSFDSIRTELRTMVCALSSEVRWKYYLNLAGQEFPLKTNLEMVRILKIYNGTNDIESFPMPERNRERFTHKFRVNEEGVYENTGEEKEPPTFKAEIRKGRQYSAFSRDFVMYVLYDDFPRSVLDYFKDTLESEESVWGTINQLPGVPGGYPVHVQHTPNNEHVSRTIAWELEDSYQCQGKYVRQVCVFSLGDIPWLLQQPNLFANKFYGEEDWRPVACLEAVLDERARSSASTINHTFYHNLPHVKYGTGAMDNYNVSRNSTGVVGMA